jgi:hypothetical protein
MDYLILMKGNKYNMKRLITTTVILLSSIIVKAQADSVKMSFNADGSFDLIKYYNHGKTKLYKLSDYDQQHYNFTNEQAIVLINLVDEMAMEQEKKEKKK